MYKVYWTKTVGQDEQLNSQNFDSSNIDDTLKLLESLRQRRKAGECLSFIGMVSENPDCVGEPGVSDKLPEGYDWKKRRL